MSRSVKLILITIVLVLLPKLVAAKTVLFNDQTWNIDPVSSKQTQSVLLRNDLDLKNLAAHILLNKPISNNIAILDENTLKQIDEINTNINQPTQSAQLKIENNWATTFVPDKNGQQVDNYKLAKLIASPFSQVQIPVLTSQPAVKLADLNTLGIKELIAVGESDYSGSSGNRIINVKVGSSKYEGLILQPGQEFSFNSYLGDIDAAHGFKPEQVIKASGIELEFGGGLCQVSSTMFRAAMNAGFPITERRNHSFAVHYYYPQGTDATIYPGASDLKFVNDYKTPILIHTYVKSPHLYFEVYGTKDDRMVTFEGPVQFDKKSDGSMKATWTRHVTKNGETSTYVAKSNYVSPNLYKKVEVASTPNPQTQQTPANTTTTSAATTQTQ